MQNLKIRVNNEAESKEAQELFFKLGGSWAGYKKIHDWPEIKQLYLGENYITFSNDINFFVKDSSKEVTLPELRAMAEPKMKEYLIPDRNYEYILTDAREGLEPHAKDWIEIPEGAEAFGYTGIVHTFYKNDFRSFLNENTDGQWDTRSETWIGMKDPVILWQREQDEPFLTPETTLNEQYVEVEEVRQHRHYFKDVSSLNEIDVYMVLKLFNVTDPCLQHIAKKALCAGQRGHKDFKKDLQDILDTAKRAVEINNG